MAPLSRATPRCDATSATRAFSGASTQLNQARDRHTDTPLNDGRVLVASGEFARNDVTQQTLSSVEILPATG